MGQWIDNVARALAGGIPRRTALKRIGGGLAGLAGATLLPGQAAAAPAPCGTEVVQTCAAGATCCNPSGPRGRCCTPPNQVCCTSLDGRVASCCTPSQACVRTQTTASCRSCSTGQERCSTPQGQFCCPTGTCPTSGTTCLTCVPQGGTCPAGGPACCNNLPCINGVCGCSGNFGSGGTAPCPTADAPLCQNGVCQPCSNNGTLCPAAGGANSTCCPGNATKCCINNAGAPVCCTGTAVCSNNVCCVGLGDLCGTAQTGTCCQPSTPNSNTICGPSNAGAGDRCCRTANQACGGNGDCCNGLTCSGGTCQPPPPPCAGVQDPCTPVVGSNLGNCCQLETTVCGTNSDGATNVCCRPAGTQCNPTESANCCDGNVCVASAPGANTGTCRPAGNPCQAGQTACPNPANPSTVLCCSNDQQVCSSGQCQTCPAPHTACVNNACCPPNSCVNGLCCRTVNQPCTAAEQCCGEPEGRGPTACQNGACCRLAGGVCTVDGHCCTGLTCNNIGPNGEGTCGCPTGTIPCGSGASLRCCTGQQICNQTTGTCQNCQGVEQFCSGTGTANCCQTENQLTICGTNSAGTSGVCCRAENMACNPTEPANCCTGLTCQTSGGQSVCRPGSTCDALGQPCTPDVFGGTGTCCPGPGIRCAFSGNGPNGPVYTCQQDIP